MKNPTLERKIRDTAEKLVKTYDAICSSCRTLNYSMMSDNPGISQGELYAMIDRDEAEQERLQKELLAMLTEKMGHGAEGDDQPLNGFLVDLKINMLKEDIEILKKEADWLAEQCTLLCDCIETCESCWLVSYCSCKKQSSKENWRKAAQEAVNKKPCQE